MKFFDLVKTFHNDESGAVTVDWVVLTAAVVGLAIAVVATLSSNVRGLGSDITSAVSTSVSGSLPD
ncbi:MAG: pilus assembly protein [Pararhodobacter sp.]|nr:pilus assembly protein [Pararhodobacter sp.]